MKYTSHYDKNCARCGETFKCKNHTNQKWCETCGPIARREAKEAYNAKRRAGLAK